MFDRREIFMTRIWWPLRDGNFFVGFRCLMVTTDVNAVTTSELLQQVAYVNDDVPVTLDPRPQFQENQ